MSILYQPKPRIPPIGFFEPISVDPKDMMTDVEFLLGVLKKLNEVIKQVNSNTKFIDEYTGKIEDLETQMLALQDELKAFETQITTDIDSRFVEIVSQINALIATAVIQSNAYTDTRISAIQNQLDQIVVGNITLYDPTTGILSPLQTVIDNLYGSGRDNALTASEYDGLALDTDTYDGHEITAFDYDQNGKTILMPV